MKVSVVEHMKTSEISQSELNANTRGRLRDRDTQRRFPPKYIDGTFKAIQSNLRALAMHPNKRRYKICICSVILGELLSFHYSEGFSIIFSNILDVNYITYYKSEKFPDSSPHHIFESENFRFPFSTKNILA